MELSKSFNIYLKGGHCEGNMSSDVLYSAETIHTFSNPRLAHGEKHGSGCVLSSALTAQLALGNDIEAAAGQANKYTHKFLASNESLLGYHQTVQL
jgi:hydroxymethylpyrimidine/phosphomethylpyrimidine kinase